MSTNIDASLWQLVKKQADPATIHDKFTSLYQTTEQMDFLWLLLYYATQASHKELVKSILDKTEAYLEHICHVLTEDCLATCLNEAVRKANHDMIRVFLDRDSELCAAEGSFYVTDNRFRLSYTPIGLAIYQDDVATLSVLMEYYSGQLMEEDRVTPLHLACKTPSTGCLGLLLANEKGQAGINVKDTEGWTPLLRAALNHPDAIPALVQHGADVTPCKWKRGNALQILSNWCIRDGPSRDATDDPCPTLQRTRKIPKKSNEVMFIADNFVELAKVLVEGGIDMNVANPPLRNFAVNVSGRLASVRGNDKVYGIFNECVSYLASVSSPQVCDATLIDMCQVVKFVANQLRRCQDYDNMLEYINLLPFIKDLIEKLLEQGANANTIEHVETGEKKTRAFNFLLAVPNACSVPLKKLAMTEFAANDDGVQTGFDIILHSVIIMYPIQIEESELYSDAMTHIYDIIKLLCTSGAICHQVPFMFTCLCLDPKVNVPILHTYLDCLNQDQYHHLLSRMLDYTTILPPEDSIKFSTIRAELTSCQNRLYTLKNLLRRDIIAFIGGRQHSSNIQTLPLPETLKSYIMTFWDESCSANEVDDDEFLAINQ